MLLNFVKLDDLLKNLSLYQTPPGSEPAEAAAVYVKAQFLQREAVRPRRFNLDSRVTS